MRRTGQLSKIFFEDEIVGLADIIDNQYVICLAKPLVSKVNVVKNLTSEIWHAWLGYLSYGTMQKLASVTLDMEFKSPILSEIYRGCIVDRQQHQPSRE